jgi:hypothetical protein
MRTKRALSVPKSFTQKTIPWSTSRYLCKMKRYELAIVATYSFGSKATIRKQTKTKRKKRVS